MIGVNEFLDLIKERTATETDSNLARKIDITRASIAAYRKGSSFPSDENMIKFAKRAKLDSGECLLLLNIWRNETEAKDSYIALFKSRFPESRFL